MKHTRLERSSTAFQKFISLVLAVATLFAIAIPANAAVSDVKPGNWAYDAVRFNVENNLIAIDYSKYNMNAPAPRQDVAYAMFKLTNGKDVEPTKSVYTQYIPQDMKNSPDKYKYSVQWAVLNKLIAGTKSNGEKFTSTSYQLWFSPTNIITREQMATLLYRLAEYDGLDTWAIHNIVDLYADGKSTSTWARDGMEWAVTHKLMSGTGNNRLSPKGTLTYGQLAQFMINYAKFKGEGTETPDVTPTPTPVPTPKPDETYHPSYYNIKAQPENANNYMWVYPEDNESGIGYKPNTGYVSTIIDLSGPWDDCKPITELPEGGYVKNGHRYNKYHVCIDDVDGIPTKEEKIAFIMINQHRANNGVPLLKWDQAAQVIAETRAIEAYNQGQAFVSEWAHVRPNKKDNFDSIINEWPKTGIFTNGYHNYLAEDAAHHCSDVYGPIAGWIDSPGHNRELLDSHVYVGAVSRTKRTDKLENTWFYDAIGNWNYGQ